MPTTVHSYRSYILFTELFFKLQVYCHRLPDRNKPFESTALGAMTVYFVFEQTLTPGFDEREKPIRDNIKAYDGES